MTILLIDNYDSFTYNIYHYIAKIFINNPNKKILVIRNDKISIHTVVMCSGFKVFQNVGKLQIFQISVL